MISRTTAALAIAALALTTTAAATTYPSGFSETAVFAGLTKPTAVRFAPDGRAFVAEKRGLVKAFDGVGDPTPTTLIDVRTAVYDYWDRGLLGLAIDPAFESNGFLYLFYTLDVNPVFGGSPPYWNDTCPTPPHPTGDGCPATARLSRFTVLPDSTLDGGEHVLLEGGWCYQYPSHSVGGLSFDSTGALLITSGEGASFAWIDYGQGGNVNAPTTPPNPCGDPPTGLGGIQSPPSAQGGALRSQDLRTPGDPQTFDGTLLRVDPATGAALPDNPLYGGAVADDDRVIAYGLRNPFRQTVRPGTNEVWIGDVGWDKWEEIDRVPSTTDAIVENFGWPCYEGNTPLSSYDLANLTLCETLYAAGGPAHDEPYYMYDQPHDIAPLGDACPNGTSAISGLVFYTAGDYPGVYEGALFFADHARNCIFVVEAGADGLPSLPSRTSFAVGSPTPVDLVSGPAGDLFYVDFEGGRVLRIRYSSTNTPPQAVASATPENGPAPLLVQLDGSGSSDTDAGATLSYAWDLDGDGQYDDSTQVAPTFSYTSLGTVLVGLRVTDDQAATDTDFVTITVGNSAPTATITAPPASLLWKVGDAIPFSGQGQDPEEGALGPAALSWEVVMHHCPGGPGDCHSHTLQTVEGTAAGSFVAPDHEWYSYLEFRLTTEDSGGLSHTASVSIDPLAVLHTYASSPPGMSVTAADATGPAPFDQMLISGTTLTIGTESPQSLESVPHYWTGWSDGGAISHEIVAGVAPVTWTASFAPCEALDPCDALDNDCDGAVDNAPAPGPVATLALSRTLLSWDPVPTAETHDVVRGDLLSLLESAGDFTLSTEECLAHQTGESTLRYLEEPGEGEAFWILVRSSSCNGAGTFDSGSPTQAGSRDAEIADAAVCP